MPGERVLFVKLSSLGDVVHNLPAITDLARRRPGAHIAWAVEEAYADLVRLHPAVRESIPVGLRGLRLRPHDAARWRRLAASRRALSAAPWDAIVDTQGLVKSALVARMARGPRVGLDRASAREPLAAVFYQRHVSVTREMHAVERNRLLAAQALGYALEGHAEYGLAPPPQPPAWAPRERYAVLLHAASHAGKQWAAAHWVTLGRELAGRGHVSIFPGGTDDERAAGAALAREVPGALAAPAMDLVAAAALLGHASCVVGVDTGLTHLAVALKRPTVGIYRATDPRLTGLHGEGGRSVGGPGREPQPAEVIEALGPP